MENIIWTIIAVLIIARNIGWRFYKRKQLPETKTAKSYKKLTPRQKKFYTVWAFFTINLKRLFRDRLALFFTFLFPLIFLFVFGGLNSGNKSVSFNVAVINESKQHTRNSL